MKIAWGQVERYLACGGTTGHLRIKRETWWWNERVQQTIKKKKEA